LIQLRAAWRREVSERARGVPVTKKSRRGPVTAVFLLMLAAAVGGFALSQYLVLQSQSDSAALRGQLQTQLAQISATAERLERATQLDHAGAARADGDHRPAEDVTATTTIGPCHARAVAADGAPVCSEQEALRTILCVNVPSSAVVTDTALFARPEDSTRPWADSRVTAGQDIGRARFADKTFERTESERTKQVCAGFFAWDGEQAISARLVIKYAPSSTAPEMSQVVVAPISDRGQ
jgi:hypothetical protein